MLYRYGVQCKWLPRYRFSTCSRLFVHRMCGYMSCTTARQRAGWEERVSTTIATGDTLYMHNRSVTRFSLQELRSAENRHKILGVHFIALNEKVRTRNNKKGFRCQTIASSLLPFSDSTYHLLCSTSMNNLSASRCFDSLPKTVRSSSSLLRGCYSLFLRVSSSLLSRMPLSVSHDSGSCAP